MGVIDPYIFERDIDSQEKEFAYKLKYQSGKFCFHALCSTLSRPMQAVKIGSLGFPLLSSVLMCILLY